MTSSWTNEPCEASPYPTAPHNLRTEDSGVQHIVLDGAVRDIIVQYVWCRWCYRSGTRAHELQPSEGPR